MGKHNFYDLGYDLGHDNWNDPGFRASFAAEVRRRVKETYQETVRIVDGKEKRSSCCCLAPGWSRRKCADVTGNKTPCRCDCHRGEIKAGSTLGTIRYRRDRIAKGSPHAQH